MNANSGILKLFQGLCRDNASKWLFEEQRQNSNRSALIKANQINAVFCFLLPASALKFRGLWLKGDERSDTVLATIRSPLLNPAWIESSSTCQLELLLNSNGFANIEIALVLEQPSHVSADIHRLSSSAFDKWAANRFLFIKRNLTYNRNWKVVNAQSFVFDDLKLDGRPNVCTSVDQNDRFTF